jgi:hypothetical protein
VRFIILLILASGCTRDPSVCVARNTQSTLYQVTGLTLPQQRSDFAIDLNGDGRVDNQLGNVVGAIEGGGFGAQEYVNAAFAAGQDPTQLEVYADQDGGAAATFAEILPGHAAGLFCGTATAFTFASTEPADEKEPVELTFTLSFAAGVTVSLVGAHLQFQNVAGQIVGQLQGAVREQEIETVVVAGIATLMTQKIQGDPTSSGTLELEQLFDVGDGDGQPCMNPDGTLSRPKDHVIGTCEVAGNSIAKNVLAPDVQMFDAEGNYSPNRANMKRDSLSVGIGFAAKAL